MSKGLFLAAVAAVTLFAATGARATLVTFFGQDLDPGISTDNSDNAHANFMSYLSSGVGTEDFEGFVTYAESPLSLTFPGSTGFITADLTGSDAAVFNGPSYDVWGSYLGRFPVSGSQYLRTWQDFNLAFSDPISTFGFYGTDIGDFGGQLTLTLTRVGGETTTLIIPAVVGSSASTNGNELFFGFIDPTQSYTNIAFGDTADEIDDVFGFDDMTIGDLAQIHGNPSKVPEPGSLAMLGLGLLALLALLGRRRWRRV